MSCTKGLGSARDSRGEGIWGLRRRDRQGPPKAECSGARTRLLGEKTVCPCGPPQAAARLKEPIVVTQNQPASDLFRRHLLLRCTQTMKLSSNGSTS